ILESLLAKIVQRGDPRPERLHRVVATLTGAGSIETYAVDVPQIADALEEVGRNGSLAISLDDYHWAPAEGIDLLISALRIVETQVCFLASARLHGLGEETTTPLPEPSADLWVEHLEIRGLESDAVAALASTVLGGEVLPSLTDALYTRTFGNPLFVTETIQSWRANGLLNVTGGFWGLDQDAVPAHARSLREMIASRLGRLDNATRGVASVLAALGRDAEFEELAAISGLASSELITILGRLRGEDLIALEAHPTPRYRLAHPLYAAALLDDEGTPQRAVLHGRVFDELRRRTRISAAELAHHAVRALTRPDDLREILTAAAEEADAAGSSEEAAVWYGHLAEESDDPGQLARALLGQANAAIQNDPQGAVGMFTYALQLETDPARRARLLLGRARAQRVVGNPELAVADLHEALPIATPDEVFDIRHALGAFHGMLGRLDEAERIFHELVRQAAGTQHEPKAVGHLGMVALIRGSIVNGTSLMETALANCSDEPYAAYLRSNLAWLFALLGRWEEAECMISRVLSWAVSSGDIYSECSILGIGGRLAAWRGDLAQAFDRATRTRRLATRLGNPADLVIGTDALASALIENEMHTDAAALLAEVIALDEPGTEEREMAYSFVVFAEACILTEDLPRARVALEHSRKHLDSSPFWEVALDRCEAQIDLACGDPRRALARLRRWLEEPTDIALERAHVLRVAGHASAAVGDRTGAIAYAGDALERYGSLGATRMAARAATWIESLAVARRGRPRSNLPGQLTSRESEILRLVVLGKSNQGVADQLFISVATVKKHIENIMAKAGVSRRTELVPFAISVGVLAADELVHERESSREQAAGSLMPGPARRGPTLAPHPVRPGRPAQAGNRSSERPGG
ncbi:MAG: LuxR C-terminal-related transcriptional regulator, partial [Actinomycetota bacterium]